MISLSTLLPDIIVKGIQIRRERQLGIIMSVKNLSHPFLGYLDHVRENLAATHIATHRTTECSISMKSCRKKVPIASTSMGSVQIPWRYPQRCSPSDSGYSELIPLIISPFSFFLLLNIKDLATFNKLAISKLLWLVSSNTSMACFFHFQLPCNTSDRTDNVNIWYCIRFHY